MPSTHHHSDPSNGNAGVRISPQRPPQSAATSEPRPTALAIELTGPLGDQVAIPLSGQVPLPLGRSEDSVGDEVTRHDPHLARAHAVLLPVAKGWFLVPEPSMNGVYVRIDGTHQLRPGDQFILGGTHGRVIEVADEAGMPSAGDTSDPAEAEAPPADANDPATDSPTPLVLEPSGVEA